MVATADEKICWLCKHKIANSCEHLYKKEILKKVSFNGIENEKPYFFTLDDDEGIINGPDSKKVKLKNIICANCNNKNSQPWDMAYSKLLKFLQENQNADHIDFQEIFGVSYMSDFKNLMKYFIKILGCMIVNGNLELPDYYPNPLTDNCLEYFKITIFKTDNVQILLDVISDKISSDARVYDTNILGRGAVNTNFSKSHFEKTGKQRIISASTWESIGQFRITSWFNEEPFYKFGSVLYNPSKIYPLIEYNLNFEETKKFDGLLYQLLCSYT